MRYLFILFAFSINSVFAGEHDIPRKSLPSSYHVILKSYPQDDLKAGSCLIKGHVYDGWSSQPLSGTLVSDLSKKNMDYADSTGAYQILFDVNDTALFAFKSLHKELVIWSIHFTEGMVYEIDFYLADDQGMTEMDKPVIYLYSEDEKEVNIQFSPNGETTFTYPKYDPLQGWTATVNQEGMSLNGASYPYLFWEAESNSLEYQTKKGQFYGSFISTDSCVHFLENSLSQLGLNPTEKTDFITFWAPRLMQKDYVFIQFVIDDDYEREICQMNVNPLPDAQRRVYMLFTLYDELTEGAFTEMTFTSFERKGFTLIEWGGSEMSNCPAIDYDTVDH